MVQTVAAWHRAHPQGIIWVEHVELGVRLGSVLGIPWFGGGAEAIRTHRGPCVASIQAHGTGKSLVQWSDALVTTPPPAWDKWEQLIGRLHRDKQQADEVDYYLIWSDVAEVKDSFRRALHDSAGNEQLMRAPKKLRRATYTFDPWR
jgi:hypothetical protein